MPIKLKRNLQARDVYVLGGEYDYHFRANLRRRLGFCQRISDSRGYLFYWRWRHFSPQHGVLVKSFEEAYVAKAMIAMRAKISILADHTKFGQDVVMCIAKRKNRRKWHHHG